MSVNVLPDMDEPRMKYLGNQLNRSRKSSIISQGQMNSTLDVYVKSINKSEKRESGKYQLKGMRLKKRLARVRGTQKVLKARRDTHSMRYPNMEPPYGVYQGEKLDSYRREVDEIIEKKHPKYRRQKDVEQHLKDGKLSGRLLDNNIARMEFEEIMTKGHRTKVKRQSYLNRENPLSQTFLNDTRNYYNSLNKTGMHMATGKHHSFSLESQRAEGTPIQVKKRTFDSPDTLSVDSDIVTLPAITVSKQFVQDRTKPSPKKFALPQLGIRRATKCSALSELRLPTKLSPQLQGRRATTFM